MLSLKKKMLMAGGARLRPQDVFATSLYTGNGGTQTITNGLDLAGKGGLVWTKSRSVARNNTLVDTQRGANSQLYSNATQAETSFTNVITSFNGNGFTLGTDAQNGGSNTIAESLVAWSFRRAKKFFDIVTYTGNGQSGRQIPHGLGDVPGMAIFKRRDGASDWNVRHRSFASPNRLWLNRLEPLTNGGAYSNDANTFTPAAEDNQNGAQYVAYLFAHNPDLIQCTSFVQPASDTTINLGWKPQFAIWKNTSNNGSWRISDTVRGWSMADTKYLYPNLTNAENVESPTYSYPTATGMVSKLNNFPNGDTIACLFIRSPT